MNFLVKFLSTLSKNDAKNKIINDMDIHMKLNEMRFVGSGGKILI